MATILFKIELRGLNGVDLAIYIDGVITNINMLQDY